MLPGQDGIRTIAALHQTCHPPPLVLSEGPEPATVSNALRAGATGYLAKDIRASNLRAALEASASVAAPVFPASASVLDAVGPSELRQPLTLRERDILRRMVKAYSNKQIAPP